MSSDYNYDTEGQFFPFFISVITAVIIAPITYNVLQPSRELVKSISNDYFKPEEFDIIESQRSKQRKKNRKTKRIIAVVLGWALVAFMVYLISYVQPSTRKIWNPYDILGIGESATVKEINKRYKRMALKFHPDKIRPTGNETLEDLNNRFTELSKAYQALTNDEVRQNYIEFGHPDGKQSYSIGIALPTFVVSQGEYLLVTYAVLLAVLLPYLVGKWWYGTQRISKDGIAVESANAMFQAYDEHADVADVLSVLSKGVEFKTVIKKNLPASLEAKIAGKLTPKERKSLQECEGTSRQALLLLHAYLHKVNLEDAVFNAAKYEAAVTARSLNSAFTTIALAFGNTLPILSNFSAMQSLLQAVPPKSWPLTQLPHITSEIAESISADKITVQSFMQIPESKRHSLTVGKGRLSEEQYKTAIDVAREIPALEVSKAWFKVVGEKHVTIGSLVSLIIKGRFIPPGSKAPEVKEADLEDADPVEGAIEKVEGTTYQPRLFAPYYGGAYAPRWHVLLTDSKQDKVVVPPFTFSEFDKPIYDEAGKPTYNMMTLKAQFQAPPQAGQYTFCLHVIADSYVGFDTKFEITLAVDETTKADEVIEEDEISEPDEDSLAGQMQVMKGGAAPSKKKKEEDSSDEESDTDGDVAEDDDSDTNTDTDEE